MDERNFSNLCKRVVVDYVNEHLDKTDGKQITEDDVYVVWMCKTLQNNKALVSTTLCDGMYYEITYNGDKGELYFDAYKKFQNVCIAISCTNCEHAHKVADHEWECDAVEYDLNKYSCFVLRKHK